MARSRTPHGQMRVRRTNECGIEWVRRQIERRPKTGWNQAHSSFFRMKSSECIVIAKGEARTVGTIRSRPVSERWANHKRPQHSSLAMGPTWTQKRQFDPCVSGVNVTPNWTKHPSPSRLLKQDLKQSDIDAHALTQGCPGCRAMPEGMRAQGHATVCRARMKELLQGRAMGQQRLEEAERRTRDTAGERTAMRIKSSLTDQQCKSRRRHCRVMLQVPAMSLWGCRSRCWQRGCKELPLKMRLETP